MKELLEQLNNEIDSAFNEGKINGGTANKLKRIIYQSKSLPIDCRVIKKNADGVLPCPYCGLYPTVDFRPSRRGVQAEAFVRCGKMICKVNPKTMIVKTKEQAIKIWNKRI